MASDSPSDDWSEQLCSSFNPNTEVLPAELCELWCVGLREDWDGFTSDCGKRSVQWEHSSGMIHMMLLTRRRG